MIGVKALIAVMKSAVFIRRYENAYDYYVERAKHSNMIVVFFISPIYIWTDWEALNGTSCNSPSVPQFHTRQSIG
jgi:hypothetical protein